MKNLCRWLTAGLLLATASAHAACSWPDWDRFKGGYISEEGRVIDPSDPRKITTSEGQSYALFFALAANDREAFDKILLWTENNLAEGSLKNTLPAWLWGMKGQDEWTVLDTNSASDADLWIAWSLLEAGRLWKEPRYSDTGKALLDRIGKEEVVNVPTLGDMLLPGKVSFAEPTLWRFNPSYMPPQLARYFTRYGKPWTVIRDTNLRLLLETAPEGFSPDWVSFDAKKGWVMKPAAPQKPLIGSYDAIRVYLWVGMMNPADEQQAPLLKKLSPMETVTTKAGVPPEKVRIIDGKTQGNGPVGFSAALLPFLQNRDIQALQRQRVADNYPQQDAYFSYVLTLFGQGWDEHRFRFTVDGELQPAWGESCTSSR
ncbi:cellulose synthase complex periplasmic endoglucanase BcsZ [Cronobacter universalis]|uniref:Glucanase n=1 Tax=Cronobacter universalis NCTC 9529 TaxID=1074000 RepID=A0AAC8VTB7_9ENTR|nr:cellulose synthase complex periplasmic endoglucanase BcsZ [Cronobacter universalis]ALB56622.1 endo-1,4-D-glucanase [Cronobacter universalis NCTC 9529]STD16607.1 Endoglucanase precursor [Cronobacter universalis NCTC 9529]